MISVVASMEREVRGLRRGIAGLLPEDAPATVHVSGVGKNRAVAGMEALLQDAAIPDAILSLGFARALVDDLHAGDLVLADRLYSTDEPDVLESDSTLLGQAREVLDQRVPSRHFVAGSITVNEAVLDGGLRDGPIGNVAWIANMEDYWIAKLAARRGVPFLSIRAVLDTKSQRIPSFAVGLGDHGIVMQALLAMANVILRPWSVGPLVRLSKQAGIAEQSLAAVGLPFVMRLTARGIHAFSEQKVAVPNVERS